MIGSLKIKMLFMTGILSEYDNNLMIAFEFPINSISFTANMTKDMEL